MSLFWGAGGGNIGITWSDFFGVGGPEPVSVAGDNALRVSPVYAAVSLIADSLASMPIHTYRRTGSSRARVDNPRFLDPDIPRSLTLFDWVHQYATSMLLRGNAYGQVIQVDGELEWVRWIHPDKVTVDEAGSRPRYRIGGGEPLDDYASGGTIIHSRAFVMPGKFKGLSPIENFAQDLELQATATRYGKDWFAGSAIPTGILKNTAAVLDPRQAETARSRFVESMKKPGPIALDKNWDWTKVSVNPNEAQFLETIKASATTIASIFRVPPEEIGGEAGRSRTYSNLEMDQIKFNIRTLLPWTRRFELSIQQLLPRGEFAKLAMDALQRPDTITRIRGNNEALKGGQLTLPEIRASDDREMLTVAEIEFWQKNYATLKSESSSESNATSTSVVQEG